MKYDVIALGELLIDFIQEGVSTQGNPLLEANPGGAPCNVLAMLSKLGKKTAFIGKVGNDGFGKMLKEKIEEAGIDSTNLLMDDSIHTTLAIVTHNNEGDRDFTFYRNPGADINLSVKELNKDIFKETKVFHFGTLSFTYEPVRETTKEALRLAKEENLIISFDPNLRVPLWKTLDEAHKYTDYGLKYADILKISDNEIEWFTNTKDYDQAAKYLFKTYPNLKLITVTLGKDGSIAYFKDLKVKQEAFLNKGDIETTGCGDTFMGCVINFVLDNGLNLDEIKLKEMLVLASAASSIVSTRKGALMVMPSIDEINEYLKRL